MDFLQSARNTLHIEKQALHILESELDDGFAKACNLILACTGRIVVTGMGKSGHIGRKIAATLASTGTPAFFMHPGEAAHGDLGMLLKSDVLVAISNSGESDEILMLMPLVKRYHITLITITKNKSGRMAQMADVALTLGEAEEACPLGLAPTSSSTATLVLGDALAVALLEARGFTEHDFALSHPAGALGKRLIMRVSDLMHAGATLPLVPADALLQDAIVEMTSKRLGLTGVVNAQQQLVGVFTDGDLRRTLAQTGAINPASVAIASIMTINPITVSADMLAYDALVLMQDRKVGQLFVLDAAGCAVGALNFHDLIKAGIR